MAIYDIAVNNYEALKTQNKNDERLRDQFETQIRVVQNGFLIEKAQLVAEMTNGELMVAVNKNLNAADDIADIDTKIGEL